MSQNNSNRPDIGDLRASHTRENRGLPANPDLARIVDLPKPIYIVQGTSGDYEDRSEWIVAVYLSKDLADEHAKLAQEAANRIDEIWREYWAGEEFDNQPTTANQFDPNIEANSTGASYWVVEKILRDKVPV